MPTYEEAERVKEQHDDLVSYRLLCQLWFGKFINTVNLQGNVSCSLMRTCFISEDDCIACLFQVERNALLIDGGIGMIKDIFRRCFPCLKLNLKLKTFSHFAEVDLGNDWLFVICFISKCLSFISIGKLDSCISASPSVV